MRVGSNVIHSVSVEGTEADVMSCLSLTQPAIATVCFGSGQ